MADRLASEARILELERELASCRAHAEASQIGADQAAEAMQRRYTGLEATYRRILEEKEGLQRRVDQVDKALLEGKKEVDRVAEALRTKETELSSTKAELAGARRDSTSLDRALGERETRVSELTARLTAAQDRVAELVRGNAELSSAAREAREAAGRASLDLTRIQQEKGIAERGAEWAHAELERVNELLAKERTAAAEQHATLRQELAEVRSTAEASDRETRILRERLEAADKAAAAAEGALRAAHEEAAERAERFETELAMSQRVAQLYREAGEERERRCDELEKALADLRAHVSSAAAAHSKALESSEAARQAAEEQAATERARARRVLTAAGVLDDEGTQGLTLGNEDEEDEDDEEDYSRAGFRTNQLQRGVNNMQEEDQVSDEDVVLSLPVGSTPSQLYSRYAAAARIARSERARARQQEIVLHELCAEVEKRALLVREQQAEYERLKSSASSLSTALEKERNAARAAHAEADALRAEQRGLERARRAAEQQVQDLGAQIVKLLAAQSGQGSPAPASNVSTASDVTDAYLLTFNNITELQANNAKLLAVNRELSREAEARREEAREEIRVEYESVLGRVRADLETLKKARTAAEDMLDRVVRQRDGLRALMSQKNRGVAEDVEEVIGREASPRPSSTPARPTTIGADSAGGGDIAADLQNNRTDLTPQQESPTAMKRKLEELEGEFEEHRQRAAKTLEEVRGELESARKEAGGLRVEAGRATAEADFERSRASRLSRSLDEQREQVQSLLSSNARSQTLLAETEKQLAAAQASADASSTKLQAVSVQLESQRAERRLQTKAAERAAEELAELGRERYRLAAELEAARGATAEREASVRAELEASRAEAARFRDEAAIERREATLARGRADATEQRLRQLERELREQEEEEKIASTRLDQGGASEQGVGPSGSSLAVIKKGKPSSDDAKAAASKLAAVEKEFAEARQRAAVAEARLEALHDSLRREEERATRAERRLARFEEEQGKAQGGTEGEEVAGGVPSGSDRAGASMLLLKEELVSVRSSAAAAESNARQFEALAQTAEEALRVTRLDLERERMESAERAERFNREIARYQSEIEQCQAEGRSAEERAAEAQQKLDAAVENGEANVRHVREELRRALADVESAKRRASELESEAKSAQQRLSDATKAYQQEVVSHGDALRRAASLERARDEAVSALEELKSETQRLRHDLEQQRVEGELALAEATAKVESAARRRGELAEQRDALERQLEDLLGKSMGADGDITVVEEATVIGEPEGDGGQVPSPDNQQQESPISTSPKPTTPSSSLPVETLRMLRREREVAETDAALARREAARLRTELAAARRGAEEARAELQASASARASSGVRGSEQQAALEARLEQATLLRESNTALRADGERLRHALREVESQRAALETELGPLKSRLATLEADLETSAAELALAREQERRWQDRAAALMKRHEAVDAAEHARIVNELEAAQKLVNDKEQARLNLEEELTKVQEELSKVKQEFAAEKENLASLQKTHASLTAEAEKAKRQHRSLLTIVHSVCNPDKLPIAQWKQAQTAKEARLVELEQKISADQAQNEAAKAEGATASAELQAKIKALEIELESAKAATEEAQNGARHARDRALVSAKLMGERITEQRKALEAGNARIVELEAEIARLKTELESVKAEREQTLKAEKEEILKIEKEETPKTEKEETVPPQNVEEEQPAPVVSQKPAEKRPRPEEETATPVGSAEGKENVATPAAGTTTVEEKKADKTEEPSSKRARMVEEPEKEEVKAEGKQEPLKQDDREPLDEEMVAEEDLVMEEERDEKQQPAPTATTAMGGGDPLGAPAVGEESAPRLFEQPHVEEPPSAATSLVREGDTRHEGLQEATSTEIASDDVEIVSPPPKPAATANENDHEEEEEEIIVAGSAEKKVPGAEPAPVQESGKGLVMAEDLEEEEDLAMEEEEDEEGKADIDAAGPSEDKPKETTAAPNKENVPSAAIQGEDIVVLDDVDEDLGVESDYLEEEEEEEYVGDAGSAEPNGGVIVSETLEAPKLKPEEAALGAAPAKEERANKPAVERPSEEGVVLTKEETPVVEQPATVEAQQPAVSVPTVGPPSSSAGIVSEAEAGVPQPENTPKAEAGTGGRRVRKRSPILWNPQEAGSTAQASPPQQPAAAAGATPTPAGRGGRAGGRAARGGRTGRGRGASGQELNPSSSQ